MCELQESEKHALAQPFLPNPLPTHSTQLLLLFLPYANLRFCLDSESMLSASETRVISSREQKECSAAVTLFDSATTTIVSACVPERQNESGCCLRAAMREHKYQGRSDALRRALIQNVSRKVFMIGSLYILCYGPDKCNDCLVWVQII